MVAHLLDTLHIQQTKSRARHCNDNALVESKNGAIIRKHMGYIHIPQKYASAINQFYKAHLNPYLNYHRSCGYPSLTIDRKGKKKKVYDLYRTPYETLTGHLHAEKFLKENISFEKLDRIAYAESDNECAASMQEAKYQLFKTFKK